MEIVLQSDPTPLVPSFVSLIYRYLRYACSPPHNIVLPLLSYPCPPANASEMTVAPPAVHIRSGMQIQEPAGASGFFAVCPLSTAFLALRSRC